MKSGLTVVKDRRKELMNSINALVKSDVLVGIPAEKATRKAGEPITNAQLGYIEEFGSPANNIPPRPHLLPGVRSVKSEIVVIFRNTAKAVLKGKPEEALKGLNRAGLIAVTAVRRKIVEGDFAPLKPATLAARRREGFSGTKPLIQSGQYLAAFTFVIRPSKRKNKLKM